MTLERTLHLLARLVGDARSINRGRYHKRLARRVVWRQWSRLGRKLLP